MCIIKKKKNLSTLETQRCSHLFQPDGESECFESVYQGSRDEALSLVKFKLESDPPLEQHIIS